MCLEHIPDAASRQRRSVLRIQVEHSFAGCCSRGSDDQRHRAFPGATFTEEDDRHAPVEQLPCTGEDLARGAFAVTGVLGLIEKDPLNG
jgi:hypothetical protein